MHKGDENDPRVAVIEVIPDEIRYWMATKGTVGRAVDIGVGAVTGKISAPGELRTITKEEVSFEFPPSAACLSENVLRTRSN